MSGMGSFREILEEALENLKGMGYKVSRESSVKGLSGVKHFFDAVIEVEDEKERFVVSVVDHIDVDEILALQAAKIDTGIPHIIIARSIDTRVRGILSKLNSITMELPGQAFLVIIRSREKKTLRELKRIVEELLKASMKILET